MKRFLSVRSIALALVAVAVLGVLALASAQTLTVEAPPGRLAQPGDYVTLVFLVRSASDMTVALDATSNHDWQLLGPAPTARLSGGTTEPVAITVAVPSDASATEPDEVTLTAVGSGQQVSATTRLEVARHLDLHLETPEQVAVGATLTVTVRNAGNVPATGIVTVTAGQQQVGTNSVTVQPGKSAQVGYPVKQEARYQVTLSRDGTELAVRFVDTIVHGPPKRSTFTLAGTAYATLDTNLAWQTSVDLQGRLSDYATTKVRLRADRPLSSHVQFRSDRFGVSIGQLWNDPLGLQTLDGFGLAALATPGAFAFEGSASWLQADQFAGRLELGYRRALEGVSIAGSLGMQAGKATAGGTMTGTFDGGKASLDASYDGDRLTAAFTMIAGDASGSYRVDASVYDGFTPFGRFNASASYRSGTTSAYITGTAPLGSEAVAQLSATATTRISGLWGGALDGAVEAGIPQSFATLRYQPDPASNVRPQVSAGVTYRTDGLGWGVTTDARLALGGSGADPGWSGSLEGRTQYFPAVDVIYGRLSARALANLPPLTLFASTGWDLGTGGVGIGAGTIFSGGPWTLQANAGASYAAGSAQPWSATLQMQGTFAFDLAVPEGVVQAAGGRRLGTLIVRVRADGEPLEGVGLAVGRYRLETRADGTSTTRLPPGHVDVAVDLSRLAANLQLEGPGTRSVTLKEGTVTTVDFTLHRTAAVRGRVLIDSNGDGVADPGARGVAATLVVIDALSQAHSVTTAEDGSYLVRGLPTGATTVSVERVPPGSAVVGSSKRAVQLVAGTTGEADFLVQPATARATVFGGAELRIRAIKPEEATVPPGSAPLLAITTVGRPDRVTVSANGRSLVATRIGPDTWRVRLPVPAGAIGVDDFEVIAVKGTTTATRSAELIIDAKAPMLTIASLGVVKAGTSAAVHVRAVFDATNVTAHLVGGATINLAETAPGRWRGDLPVASDTPAGLVDVQVVATRTDGPTVTALARVRISGP